MLNRSQWNFAHVMTVQLSWHVQNFVVIGGVHFKPEDCKVWSYFEFDRNTVSHVSVTGAMSHITLGPHSPTHSPMTIRLRLCNSLAPINQLSVIMSPQWAGMVLLTVGQLTPLQPRLAIIITMDHVRPCRFMPALLVVLCQYFEGLLPKGPYLPCLSMASRALLAGYHRFLLKSNGDVPQNIHFNVL